MVDKGERSMSDLELTDEEWKAKRKAERETEYLSRLRDRFAGQALVASLLSDASDRQEWCESFAKDAYKLADAMLAERGKP